MVKYSILCYLFVISMRSKDKVSTQRVFNLLKQKKKNPELFLLKWSDRKYFAFQRNQLHISKNAVLWIS